LQVNFGLSPRQGNIGRPLPTPWGKNNTSRESWYEFPVSLPPSLLVDQLPVCFSSSPTPPMAPSHPGGPKPFYSAPTLSILQEGGFSQAHQYSQLAQAWMRCLLKDQRRLLAPARAGSSGNCIRRHNVKANGMRRRRLRCKELVRGAFIWYAIKFQIWHVILSRQQEASMLALVPGVLHFIFLILLWSPCSHPSLPQIVVAAASGECVSSSRKKKLLSANSSQMVIRIFLGVSLLSGILHLGLLFPRKIPLAAKQSLRGSLCLLTSYDLFLYRVIFPR
jgi:hypothetical protein